MVSLHDSTTGEQLGDDLWFDNVSISDIDLSDDGAYLAIVSEGRTTVYQDEALDVTSLVARACEVLGRNASHSEWQDLTGGRPFRKTCPDAPDSAFDR